MRQVAGHALFLGDAGDVRDLPRLIRSGISAVVDLAANELPLQPPRDLVYFRVPLADGPGNPRSNILVAIQCVASLIRSRTPTLLFCSAGMSRTPAIASAAIAWATGRPASMCLAEICQSGPADVSPALWGDVQVALQTAVQRPF